jgi:HK97 family phage portal protein
MGMIERIGAAWAALRGEVGGRERKAVYRFPEWMRSRARWAIPDEYRAYVDKGYRINPLVYAPVRYKARALSSVPLVAARGTHDNPEWLPDAHRLVRLCAQPNRWQTWRAFNEQRKTYLELAGNVYTYADRSQDGTVTALYNLRPDRVRIIAGDNDVQGYYYIPPGLTDQSGVPLLPDAVAHIKYPNPLDDMEGLGYGLPPLLAVARDVDTDNAVTAFLKVLFDRGAMPMGVLRFEVPLTEEDADLARARFTEKYGGWDKWTEPVVMDQGGSYERIGLTFDELGFDVLDARNESRVLSAFGVPPILLGTRVGMNRSTYSNYDQARTQFWQDVLVPEVKMFEEADQRLLNDDAAGEFVMYDLSVVPALQADINKQIDAAHKLWAMGVPANRAFTAVGLMIEDVEGGDRAYVPTNVVGAPVAGDAAEPDADEPDADADEPVAADPKAAFPADSPADGEQDTAGERQAKAMDDIAISHEEAFRAFAAAQFEDDKRAVLIVVGTARQAALALKASIDWKPVLDDVLKVLELAGERWREAFIPLVRGVVADTGRYWRAEAGMAFDVRRLEDQAFFIDYAMEFWTNISETTRNQVGDIIRRGIDQGWSVPDMQRALQETFQQWIDGSGDPDVQRWAMDRISDYRAELIARTETTKAVNWGAMQVYRESGMVSGKEWLATLDNRVRESHRQAHRQRRDLEEPFTVGGYEMMQPGDGTLGAPIEEIAMCRCTVIPVLRGG